jgi:hypothetical protein
MALVRGAIMDLPVEVVHETLAAVLALTDEVATGSKRARE